MDQWYNESVKDSQGIRESCNGKCGSFYCTDIQSQKNPRGIHTYYQPKLKVKNLNLLRNILSPKEYGFTSLPSLDNRPKSN